MTASGMLTETPVVEDGDRPDVGVTAVRHPVRVLASAEAVRGMTAVAVRLDPRRPAATQGHLRSGAQRLAQPVGDIGDVSDQVRPVGRHLDPGGHRVLEGRELGQHGVGVVGACGRGLVDGQALEGGRGLHEPAGRFRAGSEARSHLGQLPEPFGNRWLPGWGARQGPWRRRRGGGGDRVRQRPEHTVHQSGGNGDAGTLPNEAVNGAEQAGQGLGHGVVAQGRPGDSIEQLSSTGRSGAAGVGGAGRIAGGFGCRPRAGRTPVGEVGGQRVGQLDQGRAERGQRLGDGVVRAGRSGRVGPDAVAQLGSLVEAFLEQRPRRSPVRMR